MDIPGTYLPLVDNRDKSGKTGTDLFYPYLLVPVMLIQGIHKSRYPTTTTTIYNYVY